MDFDNKEIDDEKLMNEIDKLDTDYAVNSRDSQKNNKGIDIANITYDDALDANSANAVKNSVVTNAINNKSGVVFRTWND